MIEKLKPKHMVVAWIVVLATYIMFDIWVNIYWIEVPVAQPSQITAASLVKPLDWIIKTEQITVKKLNGIIVTINIILVIVFFTNLVIYHLEQLNRHLDQSYFAWIIGVGPFSLVLLICKQGNQLSWLTTAILFAFYVLSFTIFLHLFRINSKVFKRREELK